MINLSDILVVVVAYCPENDILAHCQMHQVPYLIVDNSPQANKNLQQACEQRKNCQYIAMHDNTGIANALNVGCEYALAHGFSWVVTMDQDSEMNFDILQKMLNFANQFPALDNTAIISPRHVFSEKHKHKVLNETAELSEGICTMTSGNLLNLKLWQQLSGFDNDLFIDMVDIDYYCKALVKGYKVIMLNQVLMNHHLGNLKMKKIGFKKMSVSPAILNHSPLRKYYQIRNTLKVINRYQDVLGRELWVVKRFLIMNIIKTILFEQQKWLKIKYMFLGWRDYCHGVSGRFDKRPT